MKFQGLILLIIGLIAMPSCRENSKKKKNDTPSYENCLAKDMLFNGQSCYVGAGLRGAPDRFLIIGDAPFFEAVSKHSIHVCHLHESLPDYVLAQQQEDTRRAIFTWLSHLRDLAPGLPSEVVFHPHSITMGDTLDTLLMEECSVYDDLTIVSLRSLTKGYYKSEREYVQVREKQIWLHQFSSYNTILHELGHIFGLGDTYVEGRWDCKKDFPNSVMCETGWGQPLATDIKALRRNYCLINNGNSPGCFNQQKDSILDFLPTRVDNYRRSFLECSNSTESISLGSYSLNISDSNLSNIKSYGFYSTDDLAVTESFSSGEYLLSLSLEDFAIKPTERPMVSGKIKLTSSRMTFEGAGLEKIAEFDKNDCDFDPRFMEFIKEKTGIDLSEPAMTEPQPVVETVAMVLKKSDPTTHILHLDKKRDYSTTSVAILKARTPEYEEEYLAFLPFSQIGSQLDSDTGTDLNLHFKILNLSAGIYRVQFFQPQNFLELQLEVQD